jgi:hypothetical protein
MSKTLTGKWTGNFLKLLVVALTLLTLFHIILGQEAKQPNAPCPGQFSCETIQDHYNLQKAYKEKAIEYRKEADSYRLKITELNNLNVGNSKARTENPAVVRMRNEYTKLIEQKEALASETERFAEYHYFRAMELSGK